MPTELMLDEANDIAMVSEVLAMPHEQIVAMVMEALFPQHVTPVIQDVERDENRTSWRGGSVADTNETEEEIAKPIVWMTDERKNILRNMR